MTLSEFAIRFFTWWNGTTFGTQVWTNRHGELVGADGYGNLYHRTRGGAIDPALGFERRWVIYKGLAEPSTVGPDWHGWLHHTVETLPTGEKVTGGGAEIDPNDRGKVPQLQFTVDDPNVFTVPWTALITYRRNVGEWTELICAENPREANNRDETALPVATKPDF